MGVAGEAKKDEKGQQTLMANTTQSDLRSCDGRVQMEDTYPPLEDGR